MTWKFKKKMKRQTKKEHNLERNKNQSVEGTTIVSKTQKSKSWNSKGIYQQ